ISSRHAVTQSGKGNGELGPEEVGLLDKRLGRVGLDRGPVVLGSTAGIPREFARGILSRHLGRA
ncbi:MAG TPA: hypothetical protein VIY86_01130, partial [Pirellulaceae bacterium]